jgi:predicted RNA-binding Zn-ribbon protein involved in translation (DUF1610 family)
VPIKVTCAGCGVTLTAPDSSAGKRAKCPKCGGAIEIPAPEEIYEAEPAPLGGFSDYELEDRPAVTDDRRPCPACGEMIVRDAVKCRYCGEIFDPGLKKQEQKRLKREAVAEDDADMTTGDWVVAIICSGIGCIAGIVWIIQGKPKGKKMLLVSLAVQGFWVLVRVALEAVNTQ